MDKQGGIITLTAVQICQAIFWQKLSQCEKTIENQKNISWLKKKKKERAPPPPLLSSQTSHSFILFLPGFVCELHTILFIVCFTFSPV